MKRRRWWWLGLGFGLALHEGLRRYQRKPAQRRSGESRTDFKDRHVCDVLDRAIKQGSFNGADPALSGGECYDHTNDREAA